MLLAIRMVTNMTAGKRKHLSPGFATAREFISQGTHKHRSIKIHKITKFPKNKSDFLTYMIALSHNGLVIRAYSIKVSFAVKMCMNISFQLL